MVLGAIVPLQLESTSIGKTAILLDNDVLIQETWLMWAKRAGVNLITFGSEEELFGSLEKVEKNTEFYIDYELEGQRNGAEVAQDLFHAGFQNLILVTGHNLGALGSVPCVKATAGKHCPWKTQLSSARTSPDLLNQRP